MKTLIYKTITDALLNDWEKLWKKSPNANLVNSPVWFTAALQAFMYKEYVIVALYEDDALVAIASLVKGTIFGFSVYTIPAAEFADKPSLLVDYSNRKVKNTLLTELSKLGNVYLLTVPVNETKLITAKFKSAKAFISDINAFIEFSNGTYGDFTRQKYNHLINRVKRATDTITVKANLENPIKSLKTAFAIEIESSKKRNGKAVFDRKDAKEFYQLLAQKLPENFILSLVYFGKKAGAYSIAFDCNGKVNGSQKAHLPEFNYYMPGKLVVLHLLELYHNKKYAEFDFGRGYDGFKKDFTKTTRLGYNIIISQNKIVRTLIPLMYKVREDAYNLFVKQHRLYRMYRSVRNKI